MIEKAYNDVNIGELSEFLLDAATKLMAVGTHTSRVVRQTTRFAESFGYTVDMTIFQKNIMMTTRKMDDDAVRRTSVQRINHEPINLYVICETSRLSWKAFDNPMPLDELKKEYNDIVSTPRLSRWVVLPLVAVANAAFCRLFGGDEFAMLEVFVATAAAFFLRQEFNKHHANHMSTVFICAFVASIIAAVGVPWGFSNTPDIAVATSVLFLIPGVPLINSIIDILEGHVLAGISRSVNASIIIICIALGLTATMLILGKEIML